MKARKLLILMVILVTLNAGTECFAKREKPVPTEEAIQKVAGIWVNTEYSGDDIFHPQKFIITSDGIFEYWVATNQEYPTATGQYKILKSWMDSKGNMFIFVDRESYGGAKRQDLWKIDKSGSTLEVNYRQAGKGYPERINPKPDPQEDFSFEYYLIFYRQE